MLNSRNLNHLKGFTLLEMIISIGIFVLVATASSVLFNQALNAYRYTTSRMAAAREASLAMDWIVRDIRKKETIAPNIGTPFPIVTLPTNSDADEITIDPPNTEPGATTPVHYHLHVGDTRLWRETTDDGVHSLLAEHVVVGGLTFRYYDVNNNDWTNTPAFINTANRVEIIITTDVNGQRVTLYNVATR